jgi:hypothetical protein
MHNVQDDMVLQRSVYPDRSIVVVILLGSLEMPKY